MASNGRLWGGSRRGGVLQGCLIVLGIVLLLAIAAGVVVAMNWRTWSADGLAVGVRKAVEETTLPEDQKLGITRQVDALAQDFKDGKVTLEQMARVFEQIAESPLLPLGAVLVAEEAYIKPSAMTPEQKAEAGLHISRFARGVAEKRIEREKIDVVLAPISKRGAQQGDYELQEPQNVSVPELELMVAEAKKFADEANIPLERFQVDIAAELSKAIDQALGRTPAPAPGLPEPPAGDGEIEVVPPQPPPG